MKTVGFKRNYRNCFGFTHDLKPCKYIDECSLCVSAGNGEVYVIGVGIWAVKCKRDNPNFKGYTEQQIREATKEFENQSLHEDEIIDFYREQGLLIE